MSKGVKEIFIDKIALFMLFKIDTRMAQKGGDEYQEVKGQEPKSIGEFEIVEF